MDVAMLDEDASSSGFGTMCSLMIGSSVPSG